MSAQNTNLKILVVDDNQDFLLFIEEALSSEGYGVVTTDGGDSALKLIKQSLPDLIITDIVMENGEGTALIMDIRKISDLPILAISGGNFGFGVDYLDMALNFGANAILSKPFYKGELINKIDELLKTSK
ncbi:MAG: response regulator [Gammaproteobacteria bacterium]|nr:response regulator [Gammaproteobacteria bacterium]